MVCKKCNQIVPVNATFCPNCGAPLDTPGAQKAASSGSQGNSYTSGNTGTQGNTYNTGSQGSAYGSGQTGANTGNSYYGQTNANSGNSGYGQTNTTGSNPSYYQENTNTGNASYNQTSYNYQSTANQTQMPKKWYNAVLVLLILSALANVGQGFNFISGNQYVDSGQNVADLVYAFYPGLQTLDIVVGACCFAFAVAAILVRQQLKNFKKNAGRNYLLFNAGVIVLDVFYAVAASSITGVSVVSEVAGSIIAAGISFGISYVYFKKREHLFVN